ncbi:MAG TPA: cytochrome c biogenesis protein CcsA [Candidatus Acidoferrales bacterium]|nr:cytochrome c biogenesis protein CcsA [Candidatus Acidoferrales bacterium]
MESFFLKATAVLYLIATAAFILYLLVPRKSTARGSLLVLSSGYLLHTLAVVVFSTREGFPAVAQTREALSVYSWLLVGVYLLAQIKYRLTALGAVIGPLAFLMCFSAFAFGSAGGELPPALKTYWLPVHVTFAFLGNAVFALAFGVSLIYLFQDYQLKHKRVPAVTLLFPSLETLDRLNYTFLVWGFPLMTLGILTGTLWAGMGWGSGWSWDPRLIFSALTWLLYGGLIHGRLTAGLKGRKAALLTVVGFVVVLGYFLWGDTVFPTRHAGRFE